MSSPECPDGRKPRRRSPARMAGLVATDLSDPGLYLNRDLSMLAFQGRVLEEAWDESNPLLERVKFLAILSSNLAEFYMVRIAGLRQQVSAGVTVGGADGLSPAETLDRCRAEVIRLMQEARRCLAALLPRLAAAGVEVLDFTRLDAGQRQVAQRAFDEQIFPVLTPLALDPGRPFPHISNLSLNLAVLLSDPRRPLSEQAFARVKIPSMLPRFVRVCPPADRAPAASPPICLTWIEQLVAANLPRLFPGFEIHGCWPFRITRDAELEIQELEAQDLLETIRKGVRRRRFGEVVRCTVIQDTPPRVREILVANLGIDPVDLVELEPPLGASALWELASLDRPDLKDPVFTPQVPSELEAREVQADPDGMFGLLRRGDRLLHRPYQSFQPVLELFQQAARDPKVLAIKATLYRVGARAPVVEALLDAARHGKEVAVLVELKARFDEEPNIGWAEALEKEGAHVVYGLMGLKTHSKLALFVRREGEVIRRYVHIGTGNYNTSTAKLYTDLDYLSCDPDLGHDATQAFNILTGYAADSGFRRLLLAPRSMREDLTRRIEREIEHQRAGRGGRLIFKLNALVDPSMIQALYRASQAGVRCDLLVRGMCTLRPGIPGVSESIRVTSIVGRFLEHSRIYWFQNGGAPEVLLGSADLMPRNLNRRVEVLAPVGDPALVRRLRDEILEIYLADDCKAWALQPDGRYLRASHASGQEPIHAMAWFLAHHARPGRHKKRKRKGL